MTSLAVVTESPSGRHAQTSVRPGSSSVISPKNTETVHLAVAGIALPNDASVALHRKFGFSDVGIFDEYAMKHGAYISSLWMQRRL